MSHPRRAVSAPVIDTRRRPSLDQAVDNVLAQISDEQKGESTSIEVPMPSPMNRASLRNLEVDTTTTTKDPMVRLQRRGSKSSRPRSSSPFDVDESPRRRRSRGSDGDAAEMMRAAAMHAAAEEALAAAAEEATAATESKSESASSSSSSHAAASFSNPKSVNSAKSWSSSRRRRRGTGDQYFFSCGSGNNERETGGEISNTSSGSRQSCQTAGGSDAVFKDGEHETNSGAPGRSASKKALAKLGLTEEDLHNSAPHFQTRERRKSVHEAFARRYSGKLPSMLGMSEEDILRHKALDTLGVTDKEVEEDRVRRLSSCGKLFNEQKLREEKQGDAKRVAAAMDLK